LGDLPKSQFVAEYYQKLPFSLTGGAARLCELATWETLLRVVTRPGADVLVVRHGEPYEGPPPSSVDDVRRLCDEGFTFRVRHAERQDAAVGELAAAFSADLAAPVDIHMYCTPAETYGFSWHYDAEEVFIVQTTGRKEYSLRKNTVNPWPIEETIPADMRYEREIMPLMKCMLSAGDWIYIPSGYWHMGQASETSISLSIGVMPATGVDLYDFLRRKVLDSFLWRQRLPTLGAASPLSEDEQRAAYRELFAEFSKDLAKLLGNERTVDQFLRHVRSRPIENRHRHDQQGAEPEQNAPRQAEG
jgi:ribosomal protein L16 Arg81 hydroxylase